MGFPTLSKIDKEIITLKDFKGISRQSDADLSHLYSLKNIAVSSFPDIVARKPRKKIFAAESGEKITGIHFLDKAYVTTYCNGRNRLYIGDDFSSLKLELTCAEDEAETSLFHRFNGTLCLFNLRSASTGTTLLYALPGTFDFAIRVKAPTFTDVVTYEGRVMGCVGRRIFASAYLDIANWDTDVEENNAAFFKRFSLSSDFTTCTSYKNRTLFFTEDEMFEMRGKNKYQFDLVKIANIGCINKNSICEVNGKLYFLSTEGLICYNGSTPKRISNESFLIPLKQDGKYTASLSGTVNKLLSCIYSNEGYRVYSYDTEKQIFSCEDDASPVSMASKNMKIFFSSYDAIYETEADDLKTNVEWALETQDIYCCTSKPKNSASIEFLAEQELNSRLDVYVSYDGGEYELVSTNILGGIKNICVPLTKRDFQKLRIKISGDGDVRIKYITVKYSPKGDYRYE